METVDGIARGVADPWFEVNASNEDTIKGEVDWYIDGVNSLFDRNSSEWDYHLEQVAECITDFRTFHRFTYQHFSGDDEENKAAWGAVMAYRNLLRGDYTLAEDTANDLRHAIGNEPFVKVLLAKSYLGQGGKENLQRSIEICYQALLDAESHATVHECIATSIVTAVEDKTTIISKHLPTSEERQLHVALFHVNRAAGLWDEFTDETPQASIYATKGRILAELDHYEEAIRLIERAIEAENDNRRKSDMRISEYHRYLLRVELQRQRTKFGDLRAETEELDEVISNLSDETEDLDGELTDFHEKIDEQYRGFQNRTIQFLTFFAAILGVVVVTSNVIVEYSFQSAAGLILILTGGIVVSFGSLNYLVLRNEDSPDLLRYQLAPVGLGLLLVLVGIAIPNLLT